MLKDIKGTILKDARQEGELALKKAEEEVEQELLRARKEGEAKVKRAESEGESIVEGERRERLSWAKLEGKRLTAEAKEDAMNVAFDSLIERVKAYAKTRQYAEKAKAKISSAVKELGEKAIIRVKKGDKKLLLLNGAEVREDAEILGGAIVESRDAKLRIDLSVEETLNAQRDMVRKEIYKRLFK